jgi:hypothetical protein
MGYISVTVKSQSSASPVSEDITIFTQWPTVLVKIISPINSAKTFMDTSHRLFLVEKDFHHSVLSGPNGTDQLHCEALM